MHLELKRYTAKSSVFAELEIILKPSSDGLLHMSPNRMLIRENSGFFSFAFDSAHGKYGVLACP